MIRPHRGALGPLAIAISVWCAAGTLTVASPDLTSPRLAIPAPWWIAPVALAVAWAVPAWRRHPSLAAPALCSILPWLPLPAFSAALIWTGPMAWVPIAIAAFCALGAAPLVRIGRAIGAADPKRATIIAGVVTVLAGAAAAWSVDAHVPAGDEPHYLVIAQSLVKDHDLRIENNHRQRDYEVYYPGELAPHYVARGRDGEIYSIHAPGLPALVSPVFAVFGYRGVQAFLLILAGLTGALLWRIGWRATGETSAAWFGWAAIAGSSAFLLHTLAVFPDAPGALSVAAGVLLLIALAKEPDRVGVPRLLAVAALLAALPWYHTRFAVLAGGLGGLVTLALRRTPARAAMFLALPGFSAAAWFGFFQWIYGVLNPAAPYGGAAGTRAAYIPGGLAGLLFDGQYGLVMYAPVMAVVLPGLVRSADPAIRRIILHTAAVGAAYLAAVATYWLWWAGSPANPARFAVAALPVGAAPLAAAWHAAGTERRRLYLTLLTMTLAVTGVLVAVHGGDLAWNMRNAEAAWLDWLSPVANLPRAWPSFFWKLDPDRLSTEMPFVVHAFAWMLVLAGGWVAVARLGRERAWSTSGWRLGVAAWIIAGITVAAQIGWWLNRSSGLDPSRSQMAVLSAARPPVAIAPFSIRQLRSLDGAIRIRGEELGRLDGPAPWLMQELVPGGTYTLHISTGRPRSGRLLVYVGRAKDPVRTVPIRTANQQEASLTLPAGAVGLVIAPDRDLEGFPGVVDLEPVRLDVDRAFARLATSYGDTNVYFLDENAFVEADGFWIRGERTAAMVFEPRAGSRPSVAVRFQNGTKANTVELKGPGVSRKESLAPGEARTIELPLTARGAVRLEVTSTSGFRPSDAPGSTDARFLGVRVSVPE